MAADLGVKDETLRSLGVTTEEFPTFKATAEQSKSEANIVLMGKAGAGKSFLVNALCGAVVLDSFGEASLPATEGHKLKHETSLTSCYKARETIVDVGSPRKFSVVVWDSPGLFDGEGNERGYVLQVKHQCDRPDILLYCIDMSQIRAVVGEMVQGMTLITELLGKEVWQHAIIVLTYANLVKPKQKSTTDDEKRGDFSSTLEHWEKKIRTALLRSGVDEITAEKMVIQPAGTYTNPNLPDRQHWLGSLWLQVLQCANPPARLSILVNTQNYVNNSESLLIVDEEEHSSIISKFFGQFRKWILSLARKRQR